MHRIYETDDITVFWDSAKCRHAKKCVYGSPRTFDITRKPWIDVSIAPIAEIWQTVSECPSGALTCVYNHDIRITLDTDSCKSIAYDGEKQIGECDYRISAEGWEIYHTEVDPEYGGKGIAKRLVYKIIEAAERAGATIIPTCSYAAKVLTE